jgi:hypothetical protein
MEMQMLRKKRVDDLLNRSDVRPQRNQRGKNHITARTTDTVKPNVFFHALQYTEPREHLQVILAEGVGNLQ